MTILVDSAIWPAHDRLWCHMISDTSIDELHAFAHELEVPERGFEGDHYDLTQELRLTAIQRGARPVTGRELVLALYAAGMRRRPGR